MEDLLQPTLRSNPLLHPAYIHNNYKLSGYVYHPPILLRPSTPKPLAVTHQAEPPVVKSPLFRGTRVAPVNPVLRLGGRKKDAVRFQRTLSERSRIKPSFEDKHSIPFAFHLLSVEFSRESAKVNAEYQIRLSLFDLAFKQFQGRTWQGPVVSSKASGQKIKLNYNHNVYFHTSLSDESIALVLELVAVNSTKDGETEYTGCGWGIFRIFKYDGDMPDTSSQTSAPTQKMEVFHGTPRALLFMDEPIEGNKHVTMIKGCQVLFNIRTHRYLQKAQHLIPENILVSHQDFIPGLSEAQKDPKGEAPDTLRKPRLLKAFRCYVEKLAVTFNPSIDKFEEDLCRLLSEDHVKRENKLTDGSGVQIYKRHLQVGVHNGWTYVNDPEDVNLSAEVSGGGTFKRGSQRRGSTMKGGRRGSISSMSPTALVHKGRIDLDGMVEDPMMTVVFTVLYELGEPVNIKDRKASLGHATYMVAVRWAAWAPLSSSQSQEHTLQLLGGPGINPDALLMLHCQTGEKLGSAENLHALLGGSLTFAFGYPHKGKENIPTGSPTVTLSVPNEPMGRSTSQNSVNTEEGVLQEVATANSSRPPLPPSRSGVGPSPRGVPPLQGLGVSPPHTAYMQPQYGSAPIGYPMMPQGLYAPQGYLPMEIQHFSQSVPGDWQQQQSARGATELNELPFTPCHVPIIPTAPGMHNAQGLSRAAYAKLYTAGFPPILDRRGDAAEVIDPNDHMNFVAAKEEADRLMANEVTLQFLAFARMAHFGADPNAKQPNTIFLTFQFYRYPQVTTERLFLGNIEGDLSIDRNSLPCILQRLEKDGSIHKGPPGCEVKYHVDPGFMKPGEGRLFAQHMAQQILHIDVWDGDSLHLVGSCAVELKHLCRQGREAVQVTYELDVISTEYIEQDADLTKDQGALPIDVNSIVKGKLHLRMANIGHVAESKLSRTDFGIESSRVVNAGLSSSLRNGMPAHPRVKHVVSGVNTSFGSSYLGGSLEGSQSHVRSLANTKVCKAQHIAETNQELAQMLSMRESKNKEGRPTSNAERERKLARLRSLQQKQGLDDTAPIGTIRREKDERARDLRTIELYRSQGKRDGILSMLNQAITTEHVIHPIFASAEFFEFVLKNPYNNEHTISIEWNDPELFVITDTREWRHFKMLNEVYTSVEEGMFNTEAKSGQPQIFLRPKETVHVPFKFLSYRGDHSVQPQGPTAPEVQRGFHQKRRDDPLQSRLTKVSFVTGEGKPVAIMALKVDPQPHVIDQTFRLHHPEQSFLKKSIRLPPFHALPGVPVGGPGLNQIFLRSSDPNVICDSRKVQAGEPIDIFVKVAVGASPQIKKFFLAIYADAYLSKPVQTWQFYVHAMQRVDVTCIEGQTSRFTLMLRGTQASRLAQCFPSHPLELQLQPKEPFMLAANSLQELHVGVRPVQPGAKFLVVHVVDIETHQLIRSWLVCVSCRRPMVSKSFELLLPIGGGKGSNKKISFTNPYPNRKTFQVHTNRDDLLQFKETHLDLSAVEQTNIGLRFAPSMSAGAIEILVFINDEDDKNEETFSVRATYQ